MITRLRQRLAAHGNRICGGGRGFTLLELMITIALVAILVAVTLPAMTRTMERIDARSTARSLANVFRQARDQATSRGEVVLVQIEDSTNRGQLSIHRTDNGALRCNGLNPPSNTTQIGDSTSVESLSGELEVEDVAERDAGGKPDWLCFTPEGTVRDPTGDIIQHSDCEGENFRMWIANRNENLSDAANTMGVGQAALTGCPTGGASWDQSKLRDVRDARYLASVWLIDVPFNGSIRAYQ